MFAKSISKRSKQFKIKIMSKDLVKLQQRKRTSNKKIVGLFSSHCQNCYLVIGFDLF